MLNRALVTSMVAAAAACGRTSAAPGLDGGEVDSGTAGRPNILLIIGDDLGAADVGAYAAEWGNQGALGAPPTPVLDRLAADGVRFTTTWSNPVCSPTRATLYSGRYGFRTGVGTVVAAATDNVLVLAETSLAEAIPADYRAGLFGKWHVGANAAAGAPSPPGAQGWDIHQGILSGALASYTRWTKNVFIDDGDGVIETAEVTTVDSTRYVTEELTADAAAWIGAQDQPWLAVLALTAPHAPFHVPPDPATYSVALDATCATDVNSDRRCYRAAIEAMDTHLGRLLYDDRDGDGVDADDPLRPELANTLVIFVGDNGPPTMVAPAGFGTLNKDTVYEGGVRVPLIIAGAPVAARGRVVDDLVGVVDLFATIVAATGGDATTGIDSHSLLDYLTTQDGRPTAPRTSVYTETFAGDDPNDPVESQAAYRAGQLKLVKEKGRVVGLYELVAPLEGENLIDPACGPGCGCLRSAHVGQRTACDGLEAAMTALQRE